MTNAKTPHSLTYRPDIDGLRAVAVLAVVFCHLGLTALPGGFVGVDIFFVISGFLITGIIQREMAEGRFTFAQFYARRARRILPALLVVVLATLPFAYWLFLPSEADMFSLSAAAAVGFAANFHFKDHADYFDGVATDQPLLHIWSLAVEEQFYFLWPLLLLGLWRFVKLKWRIPLAVSLLLTSLTYAQWRIGTKFDEVFYLLPSRWWELMLGALVAMVGFKIKPGRCLTWVLCTAAAAMLLWSIFIMEESKQFPALLAVPVCLGTALIIWTGQHHYLWLHRLLATRPMVGIGKISYSLYLWHWPLIVFTAYYTRRDLSNTAIAVIFLASMVLAYLSWRYIEQPVRHAKALTTKRTLQLAVLTILGAALITLSGHFTNGWAWRVSPVVLEQEEKADQTNPKQKKCHGKVTNDFRDRLAQCSFGTKDDMAPRRIVVWGDSHADHYVPAFAKLAEDMGWRGVQATGDTCPPLWGVTRHMNGGKGDCIQVAEDVTNIVAKVPGIKIVVLAGRWDAYTESLTYPAGLPMDVHLEDNQAQYTGRMEVLATRLQDTITTLQDKGIKVVLMGQVPLYRSSPNSCLLHNMWKPKPDQDCAADASEVRARLHKGTELLQKLAVANRGVELFLPADVLCDEKFCYPVHEDTLLYRDDDHVNRHGSEHLYQLMNMRQRLGIK